MAGTDDKPNKTYQSAKQKQDRTDEAYKSIQSLEKRASDAKSSRLKDARLKHEEEDKAAPPNDDSIKKKAK